MPGPRREAKSARRENGREAQAISPHPAPGAACLVPVFIVDDSPLVRDRLFTQLSELPNLKVVGQADIAFEAIDSIRKLRPAVVVLDISMPGGSGLQVLESIRREAPNTRHEEPPPAACLEPRASGLGRGAPPTIIILTNFAHDHYRQKCLELGADYFFDKSTEFERVTEVLRHLPPPLSNHAA